MLSLFVIFWFWEISVSSLFSRLSWYIDSTIIDTWCKSIWNCWWVKSQNKPVESRIVYLPVSKWVSSFKDFIHPCFVTNPFVPRWAKVKILKCGWQSLTGVWVHSRQWWMFCVTDCEVAQPVHAGWWLRGASAAVLHPQSSAATQGESFLSGPGKASDKFSTIA